MEPPPGFEPTSSGKYFHRYGPAYGKNVEYCNIKLCLVATDLEALLDVMATLAVRSDCFYQKLSVEPRDGMHLGRCFLTSPIAVGETWSELKSHPKVFVSVQDDDFTRPYRSPR